MTFDRPPTTPEGRAIGSPSGTPVVLGDGNAWTLAGDAPLGGVFDTLYDHNVLRGRYEGDHVRTAAYRLLRANYRLDADEAFDLIRDVEPAALVPAVEAAMFGPTRRHATYSEWIVASLWANGIDPATIPRHVRPKVMEILTKKGATLPPEEFISSQEATAARRQIFTAARG